MATFPYATIPTKAQPINNGKTPELICLFTPTTIVVGPYLKSSTPSINRKCETKQASGQLPAG
jgi:hypothetical protein